MPSAGSQSRICMPNVSVFEYVRATERSLLAALQEVGFVQLLMVSIVHNCRCGSGGTSSVGRMGVWFGCIDFMIEYARTKGLSGSDRCWDEMVHT